KPILRLSWLAAKQILLGLFVTWQLLFLFLSNFLPFVPHGHEERDELIDDINLHGRVSQVEPIQDAIETLARITDRWMEATGQLQCLSLFAPALPLQAGLISVTFPWSDSATDVVNSRFEPDPQHYFRLTGTYGRPFNYESRF